VRSDVVYHEGGNSEKTLQGLHSLALNGMISRRVSKETASRLEKNRVRQEGRTWVSATDLGKGMS
jgi:hypothetical protein